MLKKKEKKLKKYSQIRKFRNSRFNYHKFVKDFYLEDDNAYISIKVNDYNDIISKYSLKNYEWLNNDIGKFIEENAYYIPVCYNVILEICGKKFNNNEKEIIIKTIHTYFGLKLGDKEQDLKINRNKSNLLLCCGLLSMFLLFILLKFINTFLEPALVLFWFFMWEYIDVSFLVRKDLKIKKTEAGQLANIQIIFHDEENNENN